MRKKIFMAILLGIMILLTFQVYAFSPSSDQIYEGIDVSEWQGKINFKNVANSGIKVVFIRASEGREYVDPYFRENYEEAKANGLKVGFYHYLTARNIEEAKEEAKFFVSNIKGTQPDCKLAMDFESFGKLSIGEINEISKAFLETVQNLSGGKECVIYSDASNARDIFSKELAKKYPIWVADYYVNEPGDNDKWSTWVGFQFTNKGRINGIRGNVDRDKFTNGILLNDTTKIPSDTTPDVKQKFKDIVIRSGNTLSQLALEYNTSYQYLAKINGIENPNLIFTGAVIKVPIRGNNIINDTSHRLYIVKRGNNLTEISLEFGVSIERIVELNDIQNPNLIFTGQILRIPTK